MIVNGQSWSQLGLDIDGEAAGDWFGSACSFNGAGDRLAVGALYNDVNGSNSGHVKIYEFNGTSNQMGSDINGNIQVIFLVHQFQLVRQEI